MEMADSAQFDASNNPHSMRKIGFLDLPAELRNAIYDLVATTRKEAGYPISKPRPTKAAVETVVTRLKRITWPRIRTTDLALTQTCQQIRSEYLPIYTAHTRRCIAIQKFARVAEELNISKHVICIPAGSVISVQQSGWTGTHRSSDDIAPLLRLALRQPDLVFSFQNAELMRGRVRKGVQRETSSYFTTLFSFQTNPVWRDFFTKAVREVYVYPDYDGNWHPKHVKVHVEVEEEWGEVWMRSRRRRRGGRQDKMDAWLTTVGLGGLVGWHGLRVYWAKAWLEGLFEE